MYTSLDLFLVMGFAWIISGFIRLAGNRDVFHKSRATAAVLLGIFGLSLLDNFIRPRLLPEEAARGILAVCRNAYFLVGPGLWFYTLSLLYPNRKKSGTRFLHALPFLLWTLWLVINPLPTYPGPSPESGMFPGGERPPLAGGVPLFFLRDMTAVLSRLAYSAAALYMLHRHRREAGAFYSHLTARNTLSWLYGLILFYSVLFFSGSFFFFLPPHTAGGMLNTAIRIVPSLLFVFLFSHFAADQSVPEARREAGGAERSPLRSESLIPAGGDGTPTCGTKDAPPVSPAEKYSRSGVTDEESSRIFSELKGYLVQERVFLDSELTLNSLAAGMGYSRHILSEAINRNGSGNFYTLINGYRLEAFLKAMEDDLYPGFTVLAAAYECGFKSSSAFYTLFKKEKGMSPRAYLREIRSE
jgi:AraC-like DNA-binding protein